MMNVLFGEYAGSAKGWIGIAFVLCIYFGPMLIAFKRHHRQSAPIAVLDLLLGWTLLGWIGALVWSLSTDVEPEAKPDANKATTTWPSTGTIPRA